MKKYNKSLMGLQPGTFPKHKRWQVEHVDYVNGVKDQNTGKERQRALNLDEKHYLARFHDEFHNGAVKKNDPNAINQSDEHRKDCYSRNNAANRDLYSVWDCGQALISLEDVMNEEDMVGMNIPTKKEYKPTPPPPKPVKVYTEEEKKKFAEEYFNKRSK